MADPTALGSITWGAVQAVIAVGIPVVGALITLAVWFHRRINALEDTDQQRRGIGKFFGDNDSPLSIGLAKEVRDLKKWQSDTQDDISELQDDVNEMSEKLDEIYDEFGDN